MHPWSTSLILVWEPGYFLLLQWLRKSKITCSLQGSCFVKANDAVKGLWGTYHGSLAPDKDESVIFKRCDRIYVAQTLISPFQLNPPCKHPSVFSLVLSCYFDAHLATLVYVLANNWFNGKTMLNAWKHQSTSHQELPSHKHSGCAWLKKNVASQESRKADSVESKQRWEDRADQRGEKKRKENHLISSCCLTFLFGHLSHCHGCLSLLVFRDLET